MKKNFILMLLFIAGLLVFVSCGGKKDDEVIVLTMGTQENPTHPLYLGYEKFGQELERISDGKMKVEIFPSSQLGDWRAQVEQIESDDLDLMTLGYGDISHLIPEYSVVVQPYVLRDYDHLLKVVKSDFGKELGESLAKHNLQELDVWYLGTRNTSANKPLNSLSDFRGLKLRVPNVDALINFAKGVGAIPSPVAFAELYLALQTGQVEAQENPLPTIYAEKLYEIQNSIIMTQHYVNGMQIIINKKTYDSFTDQQKKWVEEAIMVGRKQGNDAIFAQEEELIDEFKAMGLNVIYPDLVPFREAMKPFYDEAEKNFTPGTIAELMSIQ